MKKFFFVAALSILTLPVFAQTSISGVVVDQSGLPVIGVSVQQKSNLQNGTITDLDGNFTISVPEGSVLVFKSIGYTDVEATAAPAMQVVMTEDSELLEETVVVGYGVQKKSVVTGSITSVKAEDIMFSSNTRPEQALQGKTSGVQVLASSGAPGSSMKIRVRGYSSNGDSDPLYIVDGLRTTDISTLEPSNIASMEVLKDAASAAIYGAEAGNGVVLITTKTGQKGSTKVTYDFQYTIQSLGKTADMMNASEYLAYMKEAGAIAQDVTSGGVDTDWLDECFEASPMMKHSVSLSGGNDKVTYLGSISYLTQDGIVVGNQDNYDRFSGMFNGSVQAKKWLKFTSSIQINYNTRSSFTEDDESRGVIAGALMMDPLTKPYYSADELPSNMQSLLDAGYNLMQASDGRYYGISQYVTGECVNPLVQRTLRQVKKTGSSLVGNIAMDLTPFKGFTFTSRVGLWYDNQNTHVYKPEFYYNTEIQNTTASVEENDATTYYYQWENFASYNRQIKKHGFTVMVGSAISEYKYKTVEASGYPLIVDQESYADLDFISSQTGSTVSGGTVTNKKASFFGRVNYDYDSKYLAEFSFRADGAGTSILPSGESWGFFPAVSLGYVMSREPWFPSAALNISHFKIRASWGQNGSLSNLGGFSYAASMESSGSTLSYVTWSYINASYLYPMADGSFKTATYPSSLGNYKLTWETSEQLDFGFDLRMFNDRLGFTLDWYKKTTKDLITTNTPPLEAGNDASPINGGNVLNRGVDIELSWRDTAGDFSYGISGNISTLHNEVTYLDPSISRINGSTLMQWTGATAFEVGYPVWYFRGYKTNGVNADGSINYVDVDGNGTINADDYTMIGSAIPDFTYGLTLDFAWKGIDLTVFLNGSQGNDVLWGARRPDRPTTNKLSEFTKSKYPSAYVQVNDTGFWNSDNMVFDGSYLKIKQIQVGYTFPKELIWGLGLRVYASLDDFFTFTSYPGMDPEASSSTNSSIGIDRGFYPNAKKVVFGLSLQF